jgi:murein DD-endopeptidase MepM/ murein hydrolase activator NlpD
MAMRPIKISPLENVYYGSVRSKGRAHAGVDTIDSQPQALIGGKVVFVGSDPGGYFNYLDIYQPGTGIIERLAELDDLFFDEGETVTQGEIVGKGTTNTGVTHREIRTYSGTVENYAPSFGINKTRDWLEYTIDTGLFTQNIKRLEITNLKSPKAVNINAPKYQRPLLRGLGFENDEETVKLLQTELKKLDYILGDSGPTGDGVDGIFGDFTTGAVKDVQRQGKLIITGVVSAGTWRVIESRLP